MGFNSAFKGLIVLRGTGEMKTVTCSVSPTDKLDKRHKKGNKYVT